jgi:hypothetical protein
MARDISKRLSYKQAQTLVRRRKAKMAEETQTPAQNVMDIDTAFKNVGLAVRAFVANLETHEFLAQSMATIREQLIAYGALRTEAAELRTQLEALQAAKAEAATAEALKTPASEEPSDFGVFSDDKVEEAQPVLS